MAYSPDRGRTLPLREEVYTGQGQQPLRSPFPPLRFDTSVRYSPQPNYRQDVFGLEHQEPLVSPLMSRSPSVASDRYSVVSGLTSNTYWAGNPQNVNPPPSYVAPTGAAQVVGEHRGAAAQGLRHSESDDEDEPKSKSDVQFSGPALGLINSFLDQLLFSFLSTARSTSLRTLRPAVTEVLKARLARDAIASAEEELQELLAGGEEEDEDNTKQNAAENNRRWDLELVWKRTRLRVMVYMRLGEMEDEDEERYIKEEELFHGNEGRFSQKSGLVSWAAAIFLTGVLEYVAEQTLQVAGNAAYSRARRQNRHARSTTPLPEEQQQQQRRTPVTVEEYDVEKVALNSVLGRLWRTWRKSLRAAAPSSPTRRFSKMSNDNFYSPTSHRRGSLGNGADGSVFGDAHHPRMLDDVPEMQFPEHVLASNIPLPIGERQRDVDEIEVPGLARDPDAQEEKEDGPATTARRNSFTSPFAYKTTGGLPTPDSLGGAEQAFPAQRPAFNRQRSTSVPTPMRTPNLAEYIRQPPGAFPTEEKPVTEGAAKAPEENTKEQQQQPEPEHSEEQKAGAQDTAPHGRQPQDVKDLLDKVVDPEPAEEGAEQKDKSEHLGLLGGAIAGATAVVGAAAAMVYGSSQDSDKGDADVSRPVETDNTGAAGATPSAKNNRDVEELDRRKSLLDMKALIGAGSPVAEDHGEPQIMTSRKMLVSQPGTPTMIRSASDESHKSEDLKDPFKLGNRSGQEVPQQSPAKRQHMREVVTPDGESTDNGIGVARTADVMVESPSKRSSPRSSNADSQDARGPAKRPSRLVLGGAVLTGRNSPLDSPTFRRTESPRSSPRDFLESGPPSNTERPASSEKAKQSPPSAQTRAEPNRQVGQKRRSIPGLAFTSATSTPTVEPNANRQSWLAALQEQRDLEDSGASRPVPVPSVPIVPAGHKTSVTSESPVQEHPVVQRMASLKRKEKKSDPPAAKDDASLTSASIRGPEDFDMFVQGADTFKYTLTPETIRDRPAQNTSQARAPPPVELSSAPSVSRRPAGPIDTSEARTGRSAVSKQATSAVPDSGAAEREAEKKLEHRRSVSKPPLRNLSTHRRSGLMAREPRIMTESTRDFADFIRSTGPDKEPKVFPVISPANMSTTSLHSLRSAHVNGAASRSSSVVSQDRDRDRERTKSVTQSAMIKENIPPVPSVPAKGTGSRRNMQARTPTGVGDSNADLIDFIRTGPSQDGQHRISRSVAPFRSTMDSDQLRDMGDRINGDGPPLDLRLITNVNNAQGLASEKSLSSMKPPSSSARASANTRAGALLAADADSTVHPTHSGQLQSFSGYPSAGGQSTLSPIQGGGTPVRKRHRNKDPYAIDTDDEDDDLLTALPGSKRPEMSLMDFLNNTEPPTANAPRPIANGGSASNKARITSMSSLPVVAPAEPTHSPVRTKSSQSPAAGPRRGSAHSVQSNSSALRAPGNRPYSQATSGAPPIPVTSTSRMEARSPGSLKAGNANGTRSALGSTYSKPSNTKDLADFLKNSGPPHDEKSAPAPIVGRQSKLNAKDAEKARKKAEKDGMKAQKERKSGGGLFGRLTGRKKTWLDMP